MSSQFFTFIQATLIAVITAMVGALQAEDATSGWEQLENQNYAEALSQFQNEVETDLKPKALSRAQYGLGLSAYQTRDYELAARAFGEALIGSPQSAKQAAHYNLGNTLYRKGQILTNTSQSSGELTQKQVDQTIEQWESAIDHYEASLALPSIKQMASDNIDVVKKSIEDLKKQLEDQQQQQNQDQQQQQNQDQQQ
ncbi:MAG: tetratricopeptide repeat protein, partial [Verrucomicrobiota bacterium]